MEKMAKYIGLSRWRLDPPAVYVDPDGNVKGATREILFSSYMDIAFVRGYTPDRYNTIDVVPELTSVGRWPPGGIKEEARALKAAGYKVVE